MKIAERAVKAKRWRWMAGMRVKHRWANHIRIVTCDGSSPDPYIVINDDEGPILATVDEYGVMGSFPDAESAYPFLPDLTDPATLGCLLAVVRDAHRDAFMAAGCDGEDWIVADCDGFEVSRGRSEREALVLALEVAS